MHPPLFRSACVVGRLCLLASVAAFATPRAPAAPAGKAISDEEVVAFGEAMEQAAASGDVKAMNALIDWDAVLDAATADVEAPAGFRENFRNGARGSTGDKGAFSGQIADACSKGTTYRPIRQRTRDKHKTSLFRFAIANSGGVNYHEYLLDRDRDGKARATDIYVYFTGELFSITMRRGYTMMVADQTRGLAAKLLGPDPKLLENLGKIPEIARLLQADKPREALAIMDGMPAAVADSKTVMGIRVRAAQNIDEATYAGALERYRKLFPDDPSTNFLSIDGYTLLKDYDKALAAIDRLDKSVGGDPYIGMLRSGLFQLAGRLADARKAAEAAVAGCPDLIEPCWALLGATLRQDDHPATLATLKLIDQRFEVEFADLTAPPEYARFVKSPQHAEWKAYLAGKVAPAPALERP